MEIGTWNGEHALQMIRQAKKFHGRSVEYYGFDLFELLDDKVCSKELSKKPTKLKDVARKLQKTNCKIKLFRGGTKETLPKSVGKLPKMDFIFIDGGHSIGTIENDWEYTQQFMAKHTIVIFDDYWNRENAGCKKVIEKIDRSKFSVEILPIQDKFKGTSGILKINFVKVRKSKNKL
ncbi:MAG: class I SAM-dependent methyltransferase [Candidatus Omnitrophica bacterium]|nr:class I SAM-dependent methyltransferase [Candidatus Omnitrophota bacterium]